MSRYRKVRRSSERSDQADYGHKKFANFVLFGHQIRSFLAVVQHRFRAAAYAPILSIAMVLTFGRILVMARILDVEQFAILNTALIVSGIIAMLSCLGLFLDLQRKLPMNLERNEREAAATHIGLTIMGAAALAVAGVVLALILSGFMALSLPVVLVGIIHGFLQQLFLIATMESRSAGKTFRYAIQNVLRSSFVIVLTIPVAHFSGSGLAVIATEAAVGGIVAAATLSKVFRRLAVPMPEALKRGAGQGRLTDWFSMISLVFLSLALTASSNIDRWFAAYLLNQQSFAEYSFAWIALTAAFSVQALINASVFPAIARRMATRDKRSAFRLTLLASGGFAIGCTVFAIPGVIAAGYAVLKFYPAYEDAIPLIPALTAAAIFRLSDFWSSFLVIADREHSALTINVGSTVLGCAGWYLITDGVASQLNIAYLAASIAILTYAASMVQSWNVVRT